MSFEDIFLLIRVKILGHHWDNNKVVIETERSKVTWTVAQVERALGTILLSNSRSVVRDHNIEYLHNILDFKDVELALERG
jgi:hypothetical protein